MGQVCLLLKFHGKYLSQKGKCLTFLLYIKNNIGIIKLFGIPEDLLFSKLLNYEHLKDIYHL